jgi:hypothetical protein
MALPNGQVIKFGPTNGTPGTAVTETPALDADLRHDQVPAQDAQASIHRVEQIPWVAEQYPGHNHVRPDANPGLAFPEASIEGERCGGPAFAAQSLKFSRSIRRRIFCSGPPQLRHDQIDKFADIVHGVKPRPRMKPWRQSRSAASPAYRRLLWGCRRHRDSPRHEIAAEFHDRHAGFGRSGSPRVPRLPFCDLT